jgi:hypothetical protein
MVVGEETKIAAVIDPQRDIDQYLFVRRRSGRMATSTTASTFRSAT